MIAHIYAVLLVLLVLLILALLLNAGGAYLAYRRMVRDVVESPKRDAMLELTLASIHQRPLSLGGYVRMSYNIAKAKDWHDHPRNALEVLALVHSEISEAVEEVRAGHHLDEVYYEGMKPCGYGIELADALIRIFDHAGEEGLDLDRLVAQKMAYPETRGYRHGKAA